MGNWVRVRLVLAKGGLFIFDRYYHDFLVDPLRYRLTLPLRMMRHFAKLVPEPELVFALDAPASVLHTRKPELEKGEIEAQCAALRELATGQEHIHIVQVDRGLEEIFDELERLTLNYPDDRNRDRLGWKRREKICQDAAKETMQ